jgi:hypothetical protein
MTMESNQPTHQSLAASALLSLVGQLSSFPNPDDSTPPGPWGPVIRRAADRVSIMWRDPDPDPRRTAFAQSLALEVTDRATLMQEVADALPQVGASHGIIIIGGFVSRFIDDCGTGRIKHVFPPPRHHGGDELTPPDLLVMAAQFEQSAAATDNEGLRREFSKAGARLLDISVGRLQSAVARSAR